MILNEDTVIKKAPSGAFLQFNAGIIHIFNELIFLFQATEWSSG